MTLRSRIAAELEKAEAAQDDTRASTLRLLQCAVRVRDREAHDRDDVAGCSETVIGEVLRTMIRQREAAIREYDSSCRPDLAEQERRELAVLRSIAPAPLADDEIRLAAERVIHDLEAQGLKDMGRCVTELKSRYPGRLDPTRAGAAVKTLLAS